MTVKLRHIVTPELNEYLLKTGTKTQFMNNVEPSVGTYSYPRTQILEAFAWRDTPEGYNYWWELDEAMERD